MRFQTSAPAILFLLTIFSAPAVAHGGGHAPPPPPPPPVGVPYSPPKSAPSTPAPGGPKTPGPTGPRGAGPISPGPRSAPTGPAMPGPNTGGLSGGPSLESWSYWWSFNKERFLKLREKIGQAGKLDGPLTGAEDTETGRIHTSYHPTREQLAREVTPVLLAALDRESDAQILAAAMISAAKIGENDTAVFERLKKLLSNSNNVVSENATISLGILGNSESIAALRALYEDQEEGRQICGQKREVPWRIRTLAALGLGLAASDTKNPHHHKTIRETLLRSLAASSEGKKSRDDIAVGTLLALGMIPDHDLIIMAELEKYFYKNVDREELICSHIPPTIAKVLAAEPSAERERYARTLLKQLGANGPGLPRLVRCGAAIAFGLITKTGEPFAGEVVKELRLAVDERLSRYPEASYLSLISLGEIAGTGPTGSEIEKYLADRVRAEGGRVTTRAWSALALGIAGFLQLERNVTLQKDVSENLEIRMIELRDPEQRAACAVALGLRRAGFAASSLLKMIEDVRVDDYRGYFALALGMIDATQHAPTIQTYIKDSVRKPGFFQQAAIGLGLMGDKSVVPLLVNILNDERAQTFIIQSAVADSLGYVGDYRAVKPLVELFRDEKRERTSLTRTFAAVALGLVGDKDLQPWNTKISQQLNYFGFVETLTDLIWEQ